MEKPRGAAVPFRCSPGEMKTVGMTRVMVMIPRAKRTMPIRFNVNVNVYSPNNTGRKYSFDSLDLSIPQPIQAFNRYLGQKQEIDSSGPW